jgi:hypothetical protein
MSERFENCIEILLSGEVICEVSDSDLFRYFLKREKYEHVEKYLYQIGRKITKTRDGAGFYCVYNDISNPKHSKAAKRQLEIAQESFEGLIIWLRLARRVEPDSRPIEAGSRLVESELLAAIEGSSSLKDQLDEVAHRLKRDQKSIESKVKLRGVLKYLSDNGFLKGIGGSGSVYIATAKWSLLYDQLDFLAQYEGIYISEPAEDNNQTDMFTI